MESCDCLVFCGDDPWINEKKSQPCKNFIINKLRYKKHGTSNERKIAAMIGREIIRLKHQMSKYKNNNDNISKSIYYAKCIEIATARKLFVEVKILFKT